MEEDDTHDVGPDDAAFIVDQLRPRDSPAASSIPCHVGNDQVIETLAIVDARR
jgi:hypothetical protein